MLTAEEEDSAVSLTPPGSRQHGELLISSHEAFPFHFYLLSSILQLFIPFPWEKKTAAPCQGSLAVICSWEIAPISPHCPPPWMVQGPAARQQEVQDASATSSEVPAFAFNTWGGERNE